MVYLKKFGKKQDRVIGVDGIRITHTVVKKKGPSKQVSILNYIRSALLLQWVNIVVASSTIASQFTETLLR